MLIENQEVARLNKDQHDQIRIIQDGAIKRLKELLIGHHAGSRLTDENRKVLIAKGDELTEALLDGIPLSFFADLKLDDPELEGEATRIVASTMAQVESLKVRFQDKISRLTSGDELPPGMIKMVKVLVAIKRKLQVGDKDGGAPRQQGRHLVYSSGSGHAISGRRHPGGHGVESLGSSLADERRADPGSPPWLGRRAVWASRSRCCSTRTRRRSRPG